MKKALIVLVGAIYAASIVVVSVLGMEVSAYNNVVIVNKIEITNEGWEYDIVGDMVFRVDWDEQMYDKYGYGAVFILDWKVHPADATKKTVTVTASGNTDYEINNNGAIFFKSKGSVRVTITATDKDKKKADARIRVS